MWPAESGSPHSGHLVSVATGSPLRYGMLNMKANSLFQPSTFAPEEVHFHGFCDRCHVPKGIAVLGSCHSLKMRPAPEVNRVLVALAQLEFCVYLILQGII